MIEAFLGSIANVVEAKAKAKATAGRSDQWSVFNAQTVRLSILSANADNQSFHPSVLQSYKLDLFAQVFRWIPFLASS